MTTAKAGTQKSHAAPWRGRRRVDEPRSKLINVRCSDKERRAIQERAEQAGLSVGAYLRVQALGEPGPRAVRRPPVERKEIGRLLGHLGKVGSNVNQLAKRYNQIGVFPGYPELVAIRREMGELRDALMKALARGD